MKNCMFQYATEGSVCTNRSFGGFLIGDRDMKYTIERDAVHRCYVVVGENGGYLPNTYESKEECLVAILEHEGVEVDGL